MARPCTVCANARRNEIDEALRNNVPYETIGARYQLALMSLMSHRSHLDGHGGPGTGEAQPPAHAPATQQADVEMLLDQLQALCEKSFALLQTAEASSEPRAISLALVQVRRNLRALGDLTDHVRRTLRATSRRSSRGGPDRVVTTKTV